MTAALDEVTATVNAATLAGLAEPTARDGVTGADHLQIVQMPASLGVGTHLYRVSGENNGGQGWSYVLKIFDLPGAGYIEGSADPHAWDFWKREWLVYQAPFFRQLTGVVTPPVCLGSGTGTDGRLWIAIEDLAQYDVRPWPLERFGTVARHFGEFNARYLNEAARPNDEWLSRNWLQSWVEHSGPVMDQLMSLVDEPRVAFIYPPRIAEKFAHVWASRSALYETLRSLPQSLCHLDVHIRNVFLIADAHTVAIDWSYTGIAHLGSDPAWLVGGSLVLLEVPYNRSDELESICLHNYVQGLTAGGWNGSERDVELGYLISGVLQGGIGVVGPIVTLALNDEMYPMLERNFERPIEDLLESATQLADFWAQRIDRIRQFVDF